MMRMRAEMIPALRSLLAHIVYLTLVCVMVSLTLCGELVHVVASCAHIKARTTRKGAR